MSSLGESASAPAPRRAPQGPAGGQGGVPTTTDQQLIRKPSLDSGQQSQNVRQLLTGQLSTNNTKQEENQQQNVLVNYTLYPQQSLKYRTNLNANLAGGLLTNSGTIIRTHSGGANVFVSPTNVTNVTSVGSDIFVNKSVLNLPSKFKMNVKSAILRPCDASEVAERLSGNIPIDSSRLKRSHSTTEFSEIDTQYSATPRSLSENQIAVRNVDNAEPIARKRLKLSEAEHNNRIDLDIKVMVKMIEEQNLIYLHKIRDEYNKDLMELYYLTMDGNIMDFLTWSKSPKTHTTSYLQFMESHRIISKSEDIDTVSTNKSQNQNDVYAIRTSSPNLSQNVDVKTSIEVISTSSDAVVQLRQDVDNTNTSCPDRRTSNASLPGNKSLTNAANQEQIVEKAKQEAYVMQRISELQKEGLWTEKRLPKQQEPVRCKVHWDYLLEEMVWLATDYAQERKWKKKSAKLCAKMVQKHFQDKAIQAQKAEKAEELHRKRLCAFIAKEIKLFWSNAQKIVEFKQKTRLDETRKRALNQHLSFIVDQTEMYSKSLAKGMNQGTSGDTKEKSFSDDEFIPSDADLSDDETTIAREEKDLGKTAISDEVAALQRESELDLEDVLNTLPSEYFTKRVKDFENSDDENSEDDDDEEKSDSDSDFNCSEKESVDLEDTIAAEEKAEEQEGKEDPNVEIDMLKADSEMDINELRKKYGMPPPIKRTPVNPKTSSVNETIEDESKTSDEEDESDIGSDSDVSVVDEEDLGLKSILPMEENTNGENDDDIMDNVAALAQSIQPRGNTLSSTNVVTPVPFLLKHTLREYQHIGLDWLVTMFDRKLNGILADEMGLGKTIQTIALLAHLACAKENWGPHLIIVPTSVMLNWEMEIKKWCPGFKILTYYGNQKERRMKRTGWTKPDAFHICITSYKLVIQDHQSFRRKKWKYLILDEAQNIKNFKSQRWQMLLNFQTQQRLLLTGTPLQNNLMELWSLMHFLMPNVFQSHREFKEWFSNPVSGMIEGNNEYNESIIKRLHKVLRPFLLRRLKCEVEKQMPRKFEHVVMCRLSKRQRFLYDDFMCRAKTKETLETGNLLSVINVLMQLRKVCNHPNLFEVRPTVSPFQMDALQYRIPSLVYGMLEYNPFNQVDLTSMNLLLSTSELSLSAFVAHRMQRLCPPSRRLIEEMDSGPLSLRSAGVEPPVTPFRLFYRILQKPLERHQEQSRRFADVGTSPAIKLSTDVKGLLSDKLVTVKEEPINTTDGIAASVKQSKRKNAGKIYNSIRGLVKIPCPQNSTSNNVVSTSVEPVSEENQQTAILTAALVQKIRQHHTLSKKHVKSMAKRKRMESQSEFYQSEREHLKNSRRRHKLYWLNRINQRRCQAYPIYGKDLQNSFDTLKKHRSVTSLDTFALRTDRTNWLCDGYTNCLMAVHSPYTSALKSCIKSFEERARDIAEYSHSFVLFVPPAKAKTPQLHISHPPPSKINLENQMSTSLVSALSPKLRLLHPIESAMTTQFPEARLIQYDCGKLQTLDTLLRRLKRESHRVLIFTQMTRMLDVLEAFLNFHGHIYLRLDGTTKVDQRQILMERFNNDPRIFVFILSTRSGGVGINLTGADTVIFYDSDWNPTMDAQAQDRCHRIGQTKDVHIYRLVSEKTIEENILKKANQKRLLGDLAIEGGNFTTAYFKSSHTIQDLFSVDSNVDDASQRMSEILEQSKARMDKLSKPDAPNLDKNAVGALESAMGACEDDQDAIAAKTATAEASADLDEFDESIPIEEQDNVDGKVSKAEAEVHRLLQQLNPLEKYAMNFLEKYDGGSFSMEQLALAEKEIEEKRLEWEKNRLEALKIEQMELDKQSSGAEDLQLTYSREDAINQNWIDERTLVQMPLWSPPTPPQDDNDIYIDQSLQLLYDTTTVMSESQLPPVYVKRELKRSRTEAMLNTEGRRPIKFHRKDESVTVFPRSLFDRPSPALTKMRRDMKLQKIRGIVRQPSVAPGVGVKPVVVSSKSESEGVLEWLIYEDWALLQAVQHYQGLPLNLVVLTPGHTPNWDLVADLVNNVSRIYRSAKQCRHRYETIIVPREEGKLIYDTPKKQKKLNKNIIKHPVQNNKSRALRTSQLYTHDNNSSFIQLLKMRVENIKNISVRKTQTISKNMLVNTNMKNPKHTAVLAEFGINYDNPLRPEEIAQRRIDRLAKEKQKTTTQTQDLLRQHTMSKIASSTNQQQQNMVAQIATKPITQQQIAIPAQQITIASPNVSQIVSQAVLQNTTSVTNAQSSTLRAQRIVTPTNLQEALRQRVLSSSNSGNVVPVTNMTQAQLQARLLAANQQNQLQQQVVAVVSKCVTSTAATARNLTPAQLALYRQRTLQQRINPQTQHLVQTAGGQIVQGAAIIQGSPQALAGVVQHVQKVSLANIGNLNTITVASASGVHSVQVTQPRTQFIKQIGPKQAVTRQISDAEMALLLKKQQLLAQQKGNHTIFAPTTTLQVQQQQASTSGASTSQQPVTALVKTGLPIAGTSGASVSIPVSGLTAQNPQKVGTTVKATPQQFKQLQHMASMQRKGQKVTQLAQVGNKTGISTAQLIVQSPKNLPGVTMQQIHQVINRVQGPVLLGKAGTRVLTGPAGSRQTIQVVSAASATQTLGSLRTSAGNVQHATVAQPGTIKVQAGQTIGTRQALFSQIPAQLGGQPVSVSVRQASATQQSTSGQSTSAAQPGLNINPQQQHQQK